MNETRVRVRSQAHRDSLERSATLERKLLLTYSTVQILANALKTYAATMDDLVESLKTELEGQ